MYRGLIFDKDGTLTDFTKTWSVGTRSVFAALVGEDVSRKRALGRAIGFDWDAGTFQAGSVGVTGPEADLLAALAPLVPELSRPELEHIYFTASGDVVQQPVLDLASFFAGLSSRGCVLGVVTNDAESPARRQLEGFSVLEHLDFLAGSDSGYGAKPGPGPVNAFLDATGLSAETVLMVGDSHFDLQSARAAGVAAIGVLTGAAGRDDLAPLALDVLPDIGHLPDWLDRT